METGHDSRAVANEILLIGQQKGIPMSMMKVLKLVYFAHGWTLGITGNPLCSDPVEAWKYGPVFRNIYQSLSHNGSNDVAHLILDGEGQPIVDYNYTQYENAIIERVIENYGHLSAFRLSDITHEIGSPWDVTSRSFGNFSTISNELIRTYFSQKG